MPTERLEIIEPAEDQLLTTKDRVFNELGVAEPSEQQQELVSSLIEATSQIISDYCSRTFGSERIRELLFSRGEHEIVLERSPLTKVHHVKYKNESVEDVFPSEGYMISSTGGSILFRDLTWSSTRFTYQNVRQFPKNTGFHWWEVEYDAGWRLPNWEDDPEDDTPKLPASVERACVEFIKFKMQLMNTPSGIVRERIGQAERQFSTDGLSDDMPLSVRAYLRPYINTVVI